MKKCIALLLILCMMLSIMPVFAATDETNFTPFKLKVVGNGSTAYKRLLVPASEFPFEVTREGQLEGCLLNGKITYSGTNTQWSKEIPFENVPLAASPLRTDGKINVEFKVPDGYSMEMTNYEAANYTYDLTLSPKSKDFKPTQPTQPTQPTTPAKPADGEPGFKLAEGKSVVFIRPDSFENLGTWKVVDPSNGSAIPIFYGLTGNDPQNGAAQSTAQPATAVVDILEADTYYVWARGLDFAQDRPGIRHFEVAIDDTVMPTKGGTHGVQGWRWQKLGEISLEKGEHTVSMIDSSEFYARCEGIAITNDPDFQGPANSEVAKYMIKVEDNNTSNQPTNKLGKAVMLYLGSEKAYVLGKETKIDVAPFTENDRTLVPVRFIAESFGAKVDWDEATQTVTVKSGKTEITLVLGKTEMVVNGETKILDVPANTYSDRTFIPLRAMVEAMGKKVFWDDRGLIVISDETFDATMDKDLIDSAVQGFGGEVLDFAVVDEDLSGYSGTVGANDYKLNYFNPNELQERDGMVNTINKLKNGDPVTVGFLGGSITAQDGWRGKTLEWLRAQYPKATITEVDTALSGTGADLAACRTDKEILAHNPDLVFVEYAVNGGTAQNMEGIVRKVWAQDPATDIIFVYTATADTIPGYGSGTVPHVVQEFEKVAQYYGVPTIFFAYQIAEYHQKGEITLKGSAEAGKIHFSQDGTHPTMDGSILYAGAVARSIATMDKHTVIAQRNHELKAPLYADNWENAKMYDYNVGEFSGEWVEYTADGTGYGAGYPYTGGYMSTFQDIFPKMIGTKTPGASVTVKFTGTTIGVFDLGGTYAGQLKVTVDGKDCGVLNRHTPHSSKLRHQYIFIPDQPYGEHTVTFTLDSTAPNKTSMSNYQQNKAEYDKNEFYFGNFLIVGEIAE